MSNINNNSNSNLNNNISGNAEDEIYNLKKIIEKKDYQILHLKRNFDLSDKSNVK